MATKQEHYSKPDIKSLQGRPDTPLRVLIIDDNHVVLDSLERWLQWTQKVELVGKLRTPTSALETWELTRPHVIILSLPQGGVSLTGELTSRAHAETARTIKALYPGTRIIILAWNHSGTSLEALDVFSKIADAWIFKEDTLHELFPTLAMLFPENSRFNI